jgi:hypothetical protein
MLNSLTQVIKTVCAQEVCMARIDGCCGRTYEVVTFTHIETVDLSVFRSSNWISDSRSRHNGLEGTFFRVDKRWFSAMLH